MATERFNCVGGRFFVVLKEDGTGTLAQSDQMSANFRVAVDDDPDNGVEAGDLISFNITCGELMHGFPKSVVKAIKTRLRPGVAHNLRRGLRGARHKSWAA